METTQCCMSYERNKHIGTLKCERKRDSQIKFFNDDKDNCKCYTCKEHSTKINGLTLCGGCVAEIE